VACGVEGWGRDARVSAITSAQRRFELSRELEEVKARLDACHQTNIQPEAADVRREKELEQALKEWNAHLFAWKAAGPDPAHSAGHRRALTPSEGPISLDATGSRCGLWRCDKLSHQRKASGAVK